MRAMSLMAGCRSHPDLLTLARMSTGAPQWVHDVPVEGPSSRQYGHL
jgi:hypothetical protein